VSQDTDFIAVAIGDTVFTVFGVDQHTDFTTIGSDHDPVSTPIGVGIPIFQQLLWMGT
jgi:hypothetical protein